jgi:hypothetical protein
MLSDAELLEREKKRINFRGEVGRLVCKFATAKLDPDIMAETLFNAASKVSSAYCQAIVEAKKLFGDDSGESTVTE